MNRSLQALEFNLVIDELVRLAESEEAAERLNRLRPCREINWVIDEMRRVEEVRQMIERSVAFGGGGLKNIRQFLRRAEIVGSALNPEDLLAILHHIRVHKTVRRMLDREKDHISLVYKLANPIRPLEPLEDKLNAALTPEATVKDSASAELKRIRREIARRLEKMRSRMSSLIAKHAQSGILRGDSYTIRDGRYTLPIRAEAQRKVRGIIHDRSATGGTVFIEPATIIDMGNEMRIFELAERDEIRRILQELTGEIRNNLSQVEANLEVMTALDCLRAKAKLAMDLNAYAPTVTINGPIRIIGGRHPLLMLGRERNVVPLTLELGVDWSTLVISGPNAGGKSVALKCTGLLCAMAGCGLLVPALPGTEIPLFETIHADIGDQQSIADDLSTFTAHTKRVKDILEAAKPSSLVLIDEIGSGTDPQEGASLSIAALEELTRRKIPTIVTTHHGSLKAFAHSTDGCANGSMSFDLETLQPTFRFQPDLPGSSYAIEIAKRSGLPDTIIDRAREIMGSERTHLDELINDMTERMSRYEELVSGEESRASRQLELEKSYRSKLNQLIKQEKDVKKRAKQEADRIVQEARKEIENLVRTIRESNAGQDSIKAAHRGLEKLKHKLKIETETSSLVDEVPQPPSREPEQEIIKKETVEVNDWVSIDDTKTTGQVVEISSRGDRVCVAVGSVQLWLNVDRIRVVSPPEPDLAPVFFTHQPDVPMELDIRGLDAPEALRRVERYLYDGMMTGRERLGIIHGKGAGILSKHVRAYLRKNNQVESFRFGEYGEGDYGITIVTLKK